MEGETIFIQTDPAFQVVLATTRELKNRNRLHVTRCQTASITDIESNGQREDHRLVFDFVSLVERHQQLYVCACWKPWVLGEHFGRESGYTQILGIGRS